MIVKRGLDMDMFSGFVELQNQGKENPKLSFLLGGEGNEYLRWKTHCVQKNITGEFKNKIILNILKKKTAN